MKNTKIEWAHHTFNPWIGCTKVSPGCANCYAEGIATRFKKAQWGQGQQRVRTSEEYWKQPIKWNRDAVAGIVKEAITNKRVPNPRVFCASLADWLDFEVPTDWRKDLLDLIEATPNLDWLLLTKRPESWNARMHEVMSAGSQLARTWLNGTPPHNVWFGVSIEDQTRAEERMPEICEIPARVKFLSVEPLLGPIDLSYWLTDPIVPQVQWVIVGGESGPKSRSMHPAWVMSIRDQCAESRVPFLFKQWGGVRKKDSGRLLDGREWNEVPT